jgi:hypothetical protein
MVVFLLGGLVFVTPRQIVEVWLIALGSIFLLRDIKSERARFKQNSVWLSVHALRSVNAARFTRHVIAPMPCGEDSMGNLTDASLIRIFAEGA